MKIVILGRTRWLLDAAACLAENGHALAAVATARAAPHYGCGVDDFAALVARHGAVFLGATSLMNPRSGRP